MARKRILVTGGMGRVGAQLVPALEERYELGLVDHARPEGRDGGAPLIVGELTDRKVLDEALEGVDSVVHLAGNPDPDASWQELREPNVEGFVALLAAARRHGVGSVVFASSVHAMGAHEGSGRWPVDAAWPPAPCCAYGATKVFDEALARAYSYQSGYQSGYPSGHQSGYQSDQPNMSLIGLRLGLCTPEPTGAEAVAGWLGPLDLGRVVIAAIETDVPFGVYHALSWPSRHRWSIDATISELGYEPERDDRGQGGDDGWRQQRGDEHLSTCTPPRQPGIARAAEART